MSFLRNGYTALSWGMTPFVYGYLRWRSSKGYEDKNRLGERKGKAGLPRRPKALLWMHAVSVGESLVALAMMKAILKKRPRFYGLLTTTTVSSAIIVQKKLPKNIVHQYCPVDTPFAVRRFLNHWQPDVAVWIQSELWPNLLYQTQERGIPTILLNGQISARSFALWRRFKGVLFPLLKRLSLCGVQSERQADFFKELGATKISIMGNAKLMAPPLKIETGRYIALRKKIGKRPIWVAASTHPGEEIFVIKAHKQLKKDFPNLLTILVPRHIERAPDLLQYITHEGIKAGLRTSEPCLEECDIYIGDTLGELGLFYALSSVVMMGATFVPKGGHNPTEAAQLGAFVLHGPHTFKNTQLYEILDSLGLSKNIEEGTLLADHLRPLLAPPKATYTEPPSLMAYREEGLEKLTALLSPYVDTLPSDRL